MVGSINTDQVLRLPRLPQPGETVSGTNLQTFGGGKGANQAIATARLGGSVRIIGKTGTDSPGENRLKDLHNAGVDVSGVIADDSAPSGIALILVADSGENMIALAPGANATLTPADITANWQPGSKVCMAVLEVPVDAIETAFRIARSESVETILNAAPPTKLSDYTLSLADHLIANETEAESICGIAVQDQDTAFEAAHAIRQLVRHSAIVTMGKHGAVLYGDTKLHIKAFKVKAVDTTAAGDAFCGAFALARSRGNDLETALHQASGAGALATTIAGGQPSLPTVAALTKFLS